MKNTIIHLANVKSSEDVSLQYTLNRNCSSHLPDHSSCHEAYQVSLEQLVTTSHLVNTPAASHLYSEHMECGSKSTGAHFGCGLNKAFNCVSHVILLPRLASMGVRGAWFESYLFNRRKPVRLGESPPALSL